MDQPMEKFGLESKLNFLKRNLEHTHDSLPSILDTAMKNFLVFRQGQLLIINDLTCLLNMFRD